MRSALGCDGVYLVFCYEWDDLVWTGVDKPINKLLVADQWLARIPLCLVAVVDRELANRSTELTRLGTFHDYLG